jgi:hypothetical protein
MSTFCYVSQQIADHAQVMGLIFQEEIYREEKRNLMLTMAKKRLQSMGRFHCRFGIKPVLTHKHYIDAYSNQYARENFAF